MHLTLVLVYGSGLGEPLTSLHATRAGARAHLARVAGELLVDRLGYLPARLQAASTITQLVDAMTGIGLTATVEDLPVAS